MFPREEQFFSLGVVTHVVQAQVACNGVQQRFCVGHGNAVLCSVHWTDENFFTMEFQLFIMRQITMLRCIIFSQYEKMNFIL